jgi:hypothetical protein
MWHLKVPGIIGSNASVLSVPGWASLYRATIGAHASGVKSRDASLPRLSALVALALLAQFVACKATSGGSVLAESACDPLTAKPITLGTIIGVGQDATGTLYVDSANGIFVSNNGELIRQYVNGTGQSGSTEFIFTFESSGSDASSARTLLVETQGSTASAMALGPAGSRAFLGQSDAGVTSLSLVDSATVSGMAVVNTPNLISYIGDVANGDVVLATVPLNGDSSSDDGGLSIFYGPPTNVAQRAITAFEQSKSNNGTVTFLVAGTPYVLAFGTMLSPDAGPLGVWTLEGLTPQGGAQMTVTLRSPTPAVVPAALSLTCLP